METSNTDKDWETWGSRDPYYGVLTDERFRKANLTDESKEEFFDSGKVHVQQVLKVCRRQFSADFIPKRILDFGCGVGRLVIPFAQTFESVVGVDISLSMLAEAQHNCDARSLTNVELVESDDTLSRVKGGFDLIHSFIVLQHIGTNRGFEVVRQMLKLLNVGGMGAIQFTYGYRDLTAAAVEPVKPPSLATHLRQFAGKLKRTVIGQPTPQPNDHEPQMQMNSYDLNRMFALIQEAGVDRIYTELTDHSRCLGVFLYFQKGQSAPR